MAKRFTDSDKWKKQWFRKLSPKHKCFWIYILDNCDHAGVWDTDFETASFFIGSEITEKEARDIFSENFVEVRPGKWFIPRFIDFQYGSLNPDNRAHLSVINILKKEGAYKGLTRSLQAHKDMDKDKDMVKDKDKDKDMVKDKGNLFKPPTIEEVREYIKQINSKIDPDDFFNFYEANGWVQGKARKPIKKWKACVKTWEISRKNKQEPEYVETLPKI